MTERGGPGRRTRITAALGAAAMIAAISIANARRASWVDADARADATEAAARAAREQGDAARAAGAAADARVDELGRATAATQTDTLAAIAEHDRLLTRIGELTTQADETQAKLTAAGHTDAAHWLTFVGLQTCLDGIRTASLAGLAGDPMASVAELKRVQDYCTAASRALGVGGTSGFAFDFADPFVVQFNDRYYAYATNAGAGAVQLISSPDLQKWTLVGEALASLPSWAAVGRTWAPSVVKVAERWILYYTVRERASDLQCISSAVADLPMGPFADDSAAPLVCQRELGGSIDPSPFVADGGAVYLVWKSDAVVRGRRAKLWSVPLDATGRALGWFPIEMATADRGWEARVIEAPSMFRHGAKYYVLYSGNHWGTANYATGYLVCDTPIGPCLKPPDNVVLASRGTQIGTGGAEAFTSNGAPWVVYHAWEGTDIGYPNKRRIHTVPLSFDPTGRPVIG